jgi:hypothetical protein
LIVRRPIIENTDLNLTDLNDILKVELDYIFIVLGLIIDLVSEYLVLSAILKLIPLGTNVHIRDHFLFIIVPYDLH